tara:strand:+ start:717 stop:1154 length:438 start_codon:yes stop_codon:yes gene_type:complete
MSQYEVGTVLWIIRTDRPGLVAYRVVEEITKKTLEGEKIQYLVQPAMPRGKTVQLESIKGRVFLAPEEAKYAMIENATRAIDAIIDKTQNLVNKTFFNQSTPTPAQTPEITQQPVVQPSELKEGYQWVTMEDGTKIQVKIPEILK